MRNKLLICLVSFFIFIPSSKALLCSNEDKVKYQEMAKNISVNYEYEETENDINFSIKFTNIPEGFSIHDYKQGITYNYSGSELVIPAEKNKSYSFSVYYPNTSCHMENLYKHYITIPSYNIYYKDEVCKGIEDYKLCNKWLNINYSYDEWKEKVVSYKNSLNVEQDKIEEQKKSLIDMIVDFYTNYYIYILPSLIVVCCVGIYLYNRKHDLF